MPKKEVFLIPEQIFYFELVKGKRLRGDQKERFKDALKANFKKRSIK